MDSKQIVKAMKQKSPVIYDGEVYPRILEYILWFDENGQKQTSAVLLDKNNATTVRVLASSITLSTPESNDQ